MHIIIFSHPGNFKSKSMSIYAEMLAEGMRKRHHSVAIWTPAEVLHKIPVSGFLKKWLGYIDSFIIFPFQVKNKIKECPNNTVFVFSDQGLGPWIHLVNKKPHVVHCHDFMALKSAIGFIDENSVSWSGKIYQYLIRKGFMQSQNFISVSKKTQKDLLKFLPKRPASSQVVYNQVSPQFIRKDKVPARCRLEKTLKSTNGFQCDLRNGYILHVGANVWYKNKRGVLELYLEWRKMTAKDLPLLVVGTPGENLIRLVKNSGIKQNFIFLDNIPLETLVDLYCGASVFVFPSLEEGFGWPIAEAMACGCPVITTKLAPMTEVGGDAAYYIARYNYKEDSLTSWAQRGARVIEEVLNLNSVDLEVVIQKGINNVKRFQGKKIMNQIEASYKRTLEKSLHNV